MKTILSLLSLFILLISCDSNDSETKYSYSFNNDGEITREMYVKNASHEIEIEMRGTASFNAGRTEIIGLTPEGNINYRNKDTELTAVPHKDGVKLRIEENGREISATSDTGKDIIKEAIRHIKKLQEKYK